LIKKTQIALICSLFLTGCSGAKPELGISDNHLMECPKTPNCVSSHAKDDKHYIQPILFIGTLQEAQSQLLEMLTGWKVAEIVVSQDNYIRAKFTSMVFRFVDDVEFYFPEAESKEVIIHVRSASRVGRSDFGVNRKRIEQIRDGLL
jgi:uncharacterized protein (DUF1499 family)